MRDPNEYKEFSRLTNGSLLINEPMDRHTSWKIGGPADLFIEPSGVEELKTALFLAVEKGIPVTIIGAGTNLLVRDGGIEGIVIKISGGFSEIIADKNIISAGSGVKLNRIALFARDSGIGGLEFLSGIPGTVGGAVVMNAGAYGVSLSDIINQVFCIDFKGNEYVYSSDQLDWGYRKSIFQEKELIVTRVLLQGEAKAESLIAADMEKIISSRREKQPLEYPSAGSVFKNPSGSYAGRLIQESQCQGMQIGDAQVSLKHANFIINRGNATASQVLSLIDLVRETVKSKTGFSLEVEINILGRC
ncbi:MAG: UDP-N-acetylmuramate dehydrogenase [Peptococcaceae bacterium]|nr:UDP-N-acetylmuramate dehydrogenase [Peptococcaceae bacterium]